VLITKNRAQIKGTDDDTLTGFEPNGRDGPGGDVCRLAARRCQGLPSSGLAVVGASAYDP
jgi:hypothetical protein